MWNLLVITSVFGFCVLVQAETSNILGPNKFWDIEKKGALPWMVIVIAVNKHSGHRRWACEGSIISARHVLATRNYVSSVHDNFLVRLKPDVHNNYIDESTSLDVGVEKIIEYPKSSALSNDDNIAVLKLKQNVRFPDSIKPINLPSSQDMLGKNYQGTQVFVAGWETEELEVGESLSHLQTQQIEVVNDSECLGEFFKESLPNQICGRYLAKYLGKEECVWRRTSSLMTEKNGSYYLIGIRSYGEYCSTENEHVVFTDISRYLTWIVSKLN